MRTVHKAALALLGCGCGGHSMGESTQCLSPLEAPIPIEATSSLGFSAAEILAAVDLTQTVTVRGPDGTLVDRTLAFDYTPDGTATVEGTPQNEPDRRACADSLSEGPGLVIPGEVTVSTSDEWLSAVGPAEFWAKGTTLDAIWFSAAIDGVEASEGLREALLAGAPIDEGTEGCRAEDLDVTFLQGAHPDGAWANGPQGGINSQICNRTALGVYSWGTYY